MRSITLAGVSGPAPYGCDIDVYKNARLPVQTVFGVGTGDEEEEDPDFWAQALAFAVEEVGPWVAELLNIGPGYDSENGGEVARQLQGSLGQPWCNSYMHWLKSYLPHVWQSGDIWDAGAHAPTPWRNVYDHYVSVGAPPGVLLDQNMRPQGLGAVVAAQQATQTVTTSPNPPSTGSLQELQLLAMQLAGMDGPQAQASAEARIRTMRQEAQSYVRFLAEQWQLSNANGGGPAEAGMDVMPLLLGGAALLFLARK